MLILLGTPDDLRSEATQYHLNHAVENERTSFLRGPELVPNLRPADKHTQIPYKSYSGTSSKPISLLASSNAFKGSSIP